MRVGAGAVPLLSGRWCSPWLGDTLRAVARGVDERGIEEDRLVIGDDPRCPSHTVLTVELRRQGPTRETRVHPVLVEPRRELAVATEAVSKPPVAHDVVHSPELVVRAADRGVKERMAAIAIVPGGRDLENPRMPDGVRQFPCVCVRLTAAREHDSNRVPSALACQASKQSAGLVAQSGVRSQNGWMLRRPWRVEERGRDQRSLVEVDAVGPAHPRTGRDPDLLAPGGVLLNRANHRDQTARTGHL